MSHEYYMRLDLNINDEDEIFPYGFVMEEVKR